MHLKWIAEHDKNDNGGSSDCRCHTWRVLSDDVADDRVAKGKVTGNRNENVDAGSRSNRSSHDCSSPSRACVLDLVEDRKHLRSSQWPAFRIRHFKSDLRFGDRCKQRQ